MKNIQLKSLLLGVVLGAALALIVDALFGEQVRDNLAGATDELGEGVQEVGEKIEETGEKIR